MAEEQIQEHEPIPMGQGTTHVGVEFKTNDLHAPIILEFTLNEGKGEKTTMRFENADCLYAFMWYLNKAIQGTGHPGMKTPNVRPPHIKVLSGDVP